jgi:hypothetical protein
LNATHSPIRLVPSAACSRSLPVVSGSCPNHNQAHPGYFGIIIAGIKGESGCTSHIQIVWCNLPTLFSQTVRFGRNLAVIILGQGKNSMVTTKRSLARILRKTQPTITGPRTALSSAFVFRRNAGA